MHIYVYSIQCPVIVWENFSALLTKERKLLSRVRLIVTHGLQAALLLYSWNSPGKNTGVGCRSLLQGIFLTQGWNLGLLYCRQMLYLGRIVAFVVVVVQLLSCIQLFAASQTAARQASLSFTTSWSLLKLKSIEFVMPSNHCILCRLLLLLPSISPSIRVFTMSWLFASGQLHYQTSKLKEILWEHSLP